MAISLTDTVQAILFNDSLASEDAMRSSPTLSLATALHEHPEVLVFLHLAGYLKVRPDASIIMHYLESEIDDVLAESILKEIKGEADTCSLQIFRRIVTALKSFAWTRGSLNPSPKGNFDFRNPANVQEISSLGSGATGSVAAASYVPMRNVVACKKISFKVGLVGKFDRHNDAQETSILCHLRHPHLVQVLGLRETSTIASIFMEYVNGATIEDLSEALGGLDEPTTANITGQILDGLAFLDTKNIIHRNIKGANILISLHGCVKITDIGCAWEIDLTAKMSRYATILWLSPEIIQGLEYDARTDIWSLGVVVIQLIVGYHPWKDESTWDVTNRIVNRDMPIPAGASDNLQGFLSAIFQVQNERLRAHDLLSNDFLASHNDVLE